MIIDSVIVLYNPYEQSVLRNIRMISSKTDCCYVIVNSCDPVVLEKILLIEGVAVINNYKNIGLSKSLNIGLKKVLQGNAEGVILFDQDSLTADLFFDNLIGCYKNLANAGEKIGAIGGLIQDDKKSAKDNVPVSLATEVDVIITSGCLIPLSTL